MPPKGTWSPASNLSTLLISIRLLLANPNPEDPLLADVAREYMQQRSVYLHKAAAFTQQYAMKSTGTSDEAA
ncbi:hypothetical protein SYNPS1DRAFT_24924 [Syncephalis pseudoplumigaleata]|uniref:UBC core domain-containing protein n=1 Tax=Syncephalis pseudoplumigaleata TaxID=1712513 RepID=A0A4P9YVZ3_9FUNG|nr:hypothetical protein SYNPS1DRAFT_24924 [Syncephalis pseudoplumigaleata]|eukprot:RKP23100.1 hypothetical protein SYNPS1DRAFT_24924 [Syncephalis pseudoplumigaleata]